MSIVLSYDVTQVEELQPGTASRMAHDPECVPPFEKFHKERWLLLEIALFLSRVSFKQLCMLHEMLNYSHDPKQRSSIGFSSAAWWFTTGVESILVANMDGTVQDFNSFHFAQSPSFVSFLQVLRHKKINIKRLENSLLILLDIVGKVL